jgi:F-type H+-transporting ATPase subunit delta
MKSGKEAARLAKKLFNATVVDGKVDVETFRKILKKFSDEKPRGYLNLINAYWKLVRLEIEKSSALVESAEELESDVRESVIADLKKKYGDQVEAEFALDPELLGGMRIQVGSDVWDGSVKNRLERLADKFN